MKRHDRVVVVRRIVNQKPVGRLLALKDGRGEILLLVDVGVLPAYVRIQMNPCESESRE